MEAAPGGRGLLSTQSGAGLTHTQVIKYRIQQYCCSRNAHRRDRVSSQQGGKARMLGTMMTGAAMLALGMAAAQAGPCATDIENLQKVLATKDAGSGPTSGSNAHSPAGSIQSTTGSTRQHPPT